MNTGDVSFCSTVSINPHRSVNLWPNDNHSFSMRAWGKSIGCFYSEILLLLFNRVFFYDLCPVIHNRLAPELLIFICFVSIGQNTLYTALRS